MSIMKTGLVTHVQDVLVLCAAEILKHIFIISAYGRALTGENCRSLTSPSSKTAAAYSTLAAKSIKAPCRY